MNYWEKNKKLLRMDLQELLEKKENYGNIRGIDTEDGQHVMVAEYNGQGYLLNRLQNPDLYAKEIVQEIVQFEDYATIFLFGLSDGKIAQALLEKMGDTNHLVIYEPSLDILKYSFEQYDHTNLLKDTRVVLVENSHGNRDVIGAIEGTVDLYNKDLTQFYAQPNYEVLFEKEYQVFFEQIQYQIAIERIKINTVMQFQEQLVDAAMMNLVDSITASDIVQVKKRMEKEVDFSKTPAVIVAAGPSLDKNIDLLKQIKGKAFIFAVDAALRTLQKHNIQADAFFSVDVEAPNVFFDGIEIDKIPLFMLDATGNYLVSSHKGVHIVTKAPMRIHQNFCKKYNGYEIPTLEVSGAVGSDAMGVMRYLGFENIIYIGQDLAYDGKKTHTNEFIAEETIETMNHTERILVEGIYGSPVETNAQFDLYRRWMEVRLKNNKEYNVIDATEGGALIHGTTVMTFQQAIDEYCHGNTDFEKLFQKLPPTFDKQGQNDFKEYIQSRTEEIEQIQKKIKKAKEVYPELIRLAKSGEEETETFAKLYASIKSANNIEAETEFAYELQIYNREANFEATDEIYDKNTTVEQLLEHSYKIIQGYDIALKQLERDYREKVIERLWIE